ncbi:vWA domain-containing protein [Mycolicibacterium cosmeticum]|uniref:vWA domain-containing protein n=1 Tax=Mycolicibacterium cosmeticum TaxID=258533 RepID=UPI0032047226
MAGSTVFVVLDESASVACSGGNDPLSRRHAETALAIRHVAVACRCRRDRVALVPFDKGSAGHVAPQALTGSGIRQLNRGLRLLANNGGISSNLAPALDHVEALAAHADSEAAVVIFSDFLLTEQDPDAVLSRLRTFPGYVHAVVLGAQPPPVLITDPNVTITRLTPSSPPGSAAQAVFDGLTRYRTRRTSDSGGGARTIRNPLQRRRTHRMANLIAMRWSS